MKVYFTLSMQQGCYYVRCMVPMIAAGWDGDQYSFTSSHLDENQMARGVLDADIVVFQRPNDDRALEIAKLLRAQGKKIVMDSDDTYKDIDGHKWGRLLRQVDQNLDKFGRFADLITCSTEFLAKEYRELNPNVVVLPNCVDPDVWPDPERNNGDKVRIGIVGSTAYETNQAPEFAKVLHELDAREDVQLVLLGLPAKTLDRMKVVVPAHKKDYEFWEGFKNLEWTPLVDMKDYFDTLNSLKLDIMLIPRADRYFNRCKSNLKFLEASMLEIPVIAQGFSTKDSPYQQNPEDQKHMVVITQEDNWLPAIELLIKSKEGRRAIGEQAKKYVLENYNIEDKINLWETAYETLVAN